jgi:hypothetical protein
MFSGIWKWYIIYPKKIEEKEVFKLLLDFSKAFDTVPHKKLLHKLNNCGIDGKINKWIENFLTQRQQ